MSSLPDIDVILSTLAATELGPIASIVEKLRQTESALNALDQPELARQAHAAVEALTRGDLAEFKRIRAFIQSKLGHLR